MLRFRANVKGFANVQRQLNKYLDKVCVQTLPGLLRAADLILNDANQTYPVIPVDTGNMRNSMYIVVGGQSPYVFTGEHPFFISRSLTHKGRVYSSEMILKYEEDHAKRIEESLRAVKGKIAVALGFSIYYSGYVENMVGENINWTRPNSGPFFFQSSVERNRNKILKILKQAANES